MKSFKMFLTAIALCAAISYVGAAQAQQAPAAGASAGTSASAAAPRAQRNLLVGVVDLRAILSIHPIVADQIPALTQKVQMEQVEFSKIGQDAQEKINKLQQTYKVGTPEYDEQMAVIRKSLSDAQFKAEDVQQKLIMQRTQLLFRAYKDLQAAIQEVAKQNGVLIVHSKVKIAADPEANVSEEFLTLQEADQNTIVWNRPECDITELVKAQLLATVGASAEPAAASSPLEGNIGAQAVSAAKSPLKAPVSSANAPVNATRR